MKTILKAILIGAALLATSCKKEDTVKPDVIINQTSCNMEGIDSTFIKLVLVDYDTAYLFDEAGVFQNTDNGNGYASHFDGHIYALSVCEGVVLDSFDLIFYGADNYMVDINLQAPYWNYNYLVHLYDGKMMKYNKLKDTQLEIRKNGFLLGTCKFGRYGFYGVPTEDGQGGNLNILVDRVPQDDYMLGALL